VSIEQLLAT
jgi:hypothetical protein